jgi:proteic killer suppression protein
MIQSFRHPGLREVFERGRSARVPPQLVQRIKVRLDALEAATSLGELDQPGFRTHPLTGTKPPRHAISVNGPWRITFEWEEGRARRVDLEQYH